MPEYRIWHYNSDDYWKISRYYKSIQGGWPLEIFEVFSLGCILDTKILFETGVVFTKERLKEILKKFTSEDFSELDKFTEFIEVEINEDTARKLTVYILTRKYKRFPLCDKVC